MTDRIQQLIAECTYTETTYASGIDESVQVFDKEQFAELIVAECIEVLRLVPYEVDDLAFGEETVYQEAVKKHFGVAE